MGTLNAATITWSGTTSNAWSTTTNWNGGVAPGAASGTTNTDIALFNTNPTSKSPAWTTYLNLAGFTFDTGAGAYTIGTTSGSTAVLTSGGTTQFTTGVTSAQIMNAPLVITNASGSSAGSYTFSNNATTSAATLTLGGAISGQATAGNTTVLNLNSIRNDTLSGVISDGTGGGSLGFSKFSSGTTRLSGNSTYSGTTSIAGQFVFGAMPNSLAYPTLNGGLIVTGSLASTSTLAISSGGTLVVGGTGASANSTNRVNSEATLRLDGGTFQLATPAATFSNNQTLAGVSIGSGLSSMTSTGSAGTTSLTLTGAAGAGYIRSTNGLVNFSSGIANRTVQFTNAPTAAGGSSISGTGGSEILVGAVLNGNDFVASGSGGLTAATYATSGTNSLSSGANINITSGNTTLAGNSSYAINSLKFSDNAARTLTVGTNSSLTIASGGILTGTAVNTAGSTITSGSITSGQGDLWIYTAGTAAAVANVRLTGYALTIGSAIYGNIGVTVAGSSQVLLSGSNTYTGGTNLVGGGLVAINSDANLGVGDLVSVAGFNNLRINGNITLNRNIVVNNNSQLSLSGATLTIGGTLSGAGTLEIGSYNNAGTAIINSNQNNTFTGTYLVGNWLRADDGVGVSTNANLALAVNNVSGGSGVFETSTDMLRSVGTGPNQVQITRQQGNSWGGGFSAVSGSAGANPIAVSLGGIGTPQALTWGVGGFMTLNGGSLGNGAGYSGLVLQDGNANNTLTWANPINNNGSTVNVWQGASTSGTSTAATMTGVISGTGQFLKTGAGLLILSAENTYTGKTTIQNGALRVAMIGSVSGTGNLGAPTTSANGTIDIGAAATAATLVYTGVGETTDRVINLAGTTGGATLDQSGGVGLLKFTSALTATGSGAKTLTLQGSTAGTGEIAGAIVNYTGVGGPHSTAVTKAGTGTWTLSGNNTYTGPTSISAGTLQIAATGQINGLSGITVNGSGAALKYNSATALTQSLALTRGTLSGTGTIATAVTFGTNAVLSPGNSPGTQSYTSLHAWAPGGTYQWEFNALTGSAGTNWDLVNVTSGTFNLSGLSAAAGGQFLLDLTTLDAGNAAGQLAIPYDGGSYAFSIASYNAANFLLPAGFSNTAGTDLTGLFAVTLGNWQGAQPQLSDVSVKINSTATGIELVIVPEPGAFALAGIGVGLAVWSFSRHRRQFSAGSPLGSHADPKTCSASV